MKKTIDWVNEHEGGVDTFSKSYQKFGFFNVDGGIRYREWAPGAATASLIGEFSNSFVLLYLYYVDPTSQIRPS